MNCTVRIAFGIALAVLLGGCLYRSDLLRSVREVGVTRSRPESTIGPEETQGTLWRVYHIELSTGAVRHLLSYSPTVHLVASNCDGGNEFAWEDIYVDGATINGSTSERASANFIDAAIREGGGRLTGVSYLRDQDVRGHAEFCLHAQGGIEGGLGFTSNSVKMSTASTPTGAASKVGK
jgi:hypothetical protein